MSKLVKQTELELKEKIMDALGRAVADGVLDEAPLPAFFIEPEAVLCLRRRTRILLSW